MKEAVQKIRALVFNRDDKFRKSLEEALTGKVEMIWADTLDKVISKISADRIDLIISGNLSNGVDGFGLLEEIRGRLTEMPVIFCVNKGEISETREAFLLGAAAYYTIDELKNPEPFISSVRAAAGIRDSLKKTRVSSDLSDVLSSIGDLVFIMNSSGVFKQFYRLSPEIEYFISPRFFIERHYSQVLPPTVVRLLDFALKEIEKTGKPQHFDYPFTMKGVNLWFCAKITPFRDSAGGISGYLAIAQEITRRKSMEENLKRRLLMEKTISSISSGFVGSYDFDEAVNESLRELGRMSGAGRTYLYQLREGGEKIDNTHEWVDEGIESYIDEMQNLDVKDYPFWSRRLYGGKCVRFDDVSKMPDEAVAERKILIDHNVKSVLVFPLVDGDNPFGFIGLDCILGEGRWSREDQALLHTASEIISRAVIYNRKTTGR